MQVCARRVPDLQVSAVLALGLLLAPASLMPMSLMISSRVTIATLTLLISLINFAQQDGK